MKFKAKLYDANTLGRTIKRMAHEILENTADTDSLCLVGIKTRGVPIATRLQSCIWEIEGIRVPVGTLDVTRYRDDLPSEGTGDLIMSESELPFDIVGKTVVLADDVIYTGRTVRAAMDALIRFGRPAKIRLAVLVDRGHRELPIRADFVGKNIPTSRSEIVRVSLRETDGEDGIDLYEK